MKPGKFFIVDGEGHVLPESYETAAEATRAANRLARKNEDEYYVYKPVKVVRPKAEIETEDL